MADESVILQCIQGVVLSRDKVPNNCSVLLLGCCILLLTIMVFAGTIISINYHTYTVFSCVSVVTGTKQECERAGKLVVRQQAGSLSSWQAQQYELGTRQCPWLLEVGPGQRINITLEDYAVGDRSSLSSPVICPRYANIREQSRSTSICGGERRTKAIYLSDTNLVYVEMVPDLTKSTASFLLNFKGSISITHKNCTNILSFIPFYISNKTLGMAPGSRKLHSSRNVPKFL